MLEIFISNWCSPRVALIQVLLNKLLLSRCVGYFITRIKETCVECIVEFYYMEESVLLGAKPIVDSIRHFIRNPSGVFSVRHLYECHIVQWRHDSRFLLLLNWFLASRLLFRIHISNLVPRAHVSFGLALTKRHVDSGNKIELTLEKCAYGPRFSQHFYHIFQNSQALI